MFDIKEYEAIVMRYSKPLYRYCYLKLRYNKEMTEETLNDVFRVLFEKWESLDKSDNIRAYLYRVADMCIKNTLRKYTRYYSKNLSYEESVEKGDFAQIKHYDGYFEENEPEKQMDEISKALPEEQRALFALRYIEKKTINEISLETGIPYSTLRLRFIKIERAIREKLQN